CWRARSTTSAPSSRRWARPRERARRESHRIHRRAARGTRRRAADGARPRVAGARLRGGPALRRPPGAQAARRVSPPAGLTGWGSMNPPPPDPIEKFEQWLADATAAGIHEPTAMTLATAGADG